MSDLARLSCSNCGAALPYVAGQEHYQCGYCGASFVLRRKSGHLELERLDEKLDNVHAGVQDLLDRVGDATIHSSLASEMAIRRLREDVKPYQQQEAVLTAEINGLQAQIAAANTEIPAIENQIHELERARVRIYLRRGSGRLVFLIVVTALVWIAWLFGLLDRSPDSPLMQFLDDFEDLPAESLITGLNMLMALVPVYVVFALAGTPTRPDSLLSPGESAGSASTRRAAHADRADAPVCPAESKADRKQGGGTP
jgi:predicted RNA-binding Zn-ribbon protein involved in translation (DUF1610 family)